MRNPFLFFFFLLLFFYTNSFGQLSDTSDLRSGDVISADTGIVKKELTPIEKIIIRNKILNTTGEPRPIDSKQRKRVSLDALFYILLFLIFFIAIIKTIYGRYFNNLLKVFFQTSLRQSQLTDQLMNAGLPSLLMNVFFILTGALYFTLLAESHSVHTGFKWELFGLTAMVLIIVYVSKYASLQFAGWISGYDKEAESYSFIIFLINKVMALAILPFLVLIAFANERIAEQAIRISFFVIALIFISRFFRSLSVLQGRFRFNRFHFFLYIVGVELIPILLICKFGYKFFIKNL